MLKLMNIAVMLVILCVEFHSSYGEKLKCEFVNQPYYIVGTLYSCKVTTLDNSFNNMTINGYTGTHLANKNDIDVEGIWIYETNTKYIPEGLGSISNLRALGIDKSQLLEIKADRFLGMQNLEYLGLWYNKLTSIPTDAFSSLMMLKGIYLYGNQIKYIGFGVFDQLMNLNRVNLDGNICIKNNYIGGTAITQMKEDIKVNCKNPNEVPEMTTTTTLEALKNEVKEQQKKNEIEMNKLRDDLMKEQSENRKVKIERDALAKEKVALLKERYALMINHDAMMMEFNNKTSEINELNEKNDKCNKQYNEQLSHHHDHDSANVGRRFK